MAASSTSGMSHQSLLQPHDARLDGGEVEQVVDQAAEARRLGGDPVEEPVLRVGVPGHVRLQEAGGVAADGGERGAQLVAQPGQEAPLQFLRPAQRGRFLVREAASSRSSASRSECAASSISAVSSAVARPFPAGQQRRSGPPGAGNATEHPPPRLSSAAWPGRRPVGPSRERPGRGRPRAPRRRRRRRPPGRPGDPANARHRGRAVRRLASAAPPRRPAGRAAAPAARRRAPRPPGSGRPASPASRGWSPAPGCARSPGPAAGRARPRSPRTRRRA